MADDDTLALQRRMLDAVQEVLAGTEWAPPEGGIVTEAVVIVGWADAAGGFGHGHLRCGSPWGTEGLVHGALREIQYAGPPDDDDEAM